MADTHKCPFVAIFTAPHAALNTDQSIIGAFLSFYNSMRLPKNGPQRRLKCCSIRKISHLGVSGWEITWGIAWCEPDTLSIWSSWVEVFCHIPPCQLTESSGFQTNRLQDSIHLGKPRCCGNTVSVIFVRDPRFLHTSNSIKDVVGKCRP